jgi:hypothetical protein
MKCDAINEEKMLRNTEKVEEAKLAENEATATVDKCRCMAKTQPASPQDLDKCESDSTITTPGKCPADRCEWGPTAACKLQAAAAASAADEKAKKKPTVSPAVARFASVLKQFL